MASTGNNESLEQAAQPQLCTKGCNFFANVGCGGMCSKCHREHLAELERKMLKDKPLAPPPAPATTTIVPAPAKALQEAPAPSPAAQAASTSPSAAEPSTSGSGEGCKAPSRCVECRKKVGLTGFKCKCGNLYCGQHRYAESHNCPFDYKSTQRQKLAESNPVVQASKVQKI